MATEKRFNLVDEKWIPIVGKDHVSLMDVFTVEDLPGIGGNPMEKIALTQLLLAIAQAAATPKDIDAWNTLRPDGLAKNAASICRGIRKHFSFMAKPHSCKCHG